MIAQPTGLLLSESLLMSTGFLVLATMVSFNTIVFLGLTIAKIVPWPNQIHSDQLRMWFSKLGIVVKSPQPNRPAGSVARSSSEEPLAMSLARTEIPRAFGLLGVVSAAFAIVDGVTSNLAHLAADAGGIAVSAILLLASIVLSHRRINPRALMWGWGLTCTALVSQLVWYSTVLQSQLPISFSLLVIIIALPVSLAWKPALTTGLLMATITVAGEVLWVAEGNDNRTMAALGVLSLIIGAVLLRLRLAMIDTLAERTRVLEQIAGSDPVTGVLSRRGLLGLVGGLADNAERAGTDFFVVMVLVRQMADINRTYGHDYGDTVLKTVAAVLRNAGRPGDLVGRWTGSRFVVAGMGECPHPELLAAQVDEGLRATGVQIGKRTVTVAVGACAAKPGHTTFEQMLRAAEHDVYQRLGARTV